MSDLKMMIEFASAFERRFRDVRKPSHCLSAEWRYVPEYLTAAADDKVRVDAPFGEDAFLTGLWAWKRVPDELKQAVKVAFGFGARLQAEHESRLTAAFARYGKSAFDSQVDMGLQVWLREIKVECETQADFELIFYS